MVKPPFYEKNKAKMKDGRWLEEEEDAKRSLAYATKQGTTSNWTTMPKKAAGLRKCGKSCRIKWSGNQRPPDLGDDNFTPEEEDLIIKLHSTIGTSRDMKNAFNMRSELYNQNPQQRPSYFHSHYSTRIAPLELEASTQQHFFSNDGISAGNQSLDLLSQLQAITMVTEATDYANNSTQQMQIEFTYSSASSSSPESPPSKTNQAITPSPGFSWCDFLLEDAYASTRLQEQGNSIIFPPTDELSSIQVQNTSDAAEEEMNMLMKTAEASTVASGSFVENMLEGENEMLSDFHGLLEEPFYY
ncbi:OLC1v1012847C1 [Oldenlandia corymbosa var. corymbosa]|uniref:OLC1v1012847C1 n=1 Tax=Oldenlandia corymbosa var. corymbosa TaxID=529605 RepID=A0AAV1DXK1_OLDCO|nr:OLC1v1012847C1 [Oldenlandia corymbosa var. corymbosa]